MSEILKYLKIQNNHKNFFDFISGLEKSFFKVENITIKQTLFICGMPRSGTTFLTHLIESSKNFSSFKYQDLPFYTVPILWSYFSGLFYGNKKKIKRPHGDELLIDKLSPDAFEELIWKQLIPNYEKDGYWKYIDKNDPTIKFSKLEAFIKKVIYIYKNKNYLSKSNNNIFRINYLLNSFPNSKVIIVIRNPIDTAISLTRVHLKFLKIHKTDNKFSEELKYLGHLEFGYYRKLFKLEKKIKTNTSQIKMYLEKCEELNAFIIKKYLHEIKDKKIAIINYDNLSKFENLTELFKDIDIKEFDLMQKYFNKNFKKNKRFHINNNNYDEYFKSFRILDKFSLI